MKIPVVLLLVGILRLTADVPSSAAPEVELPVPRDENPLLKIDFGQKHREAVAERQYQKRQYAEAYEAFSRLTTTASDPEKKAWFRARAVMALSELEGRLDEAMQLARNIALRPYAAYAQMEILNSKQKFAELSEAFADEEIATWPEAFAAEAFYLRGTARHRAGGATPQEQLRDWLDVVVRAEPRERMWPMSVSRAASIYRELGQDEKALILLRRALEAHAQGAWQGHVYHGWAVTGVASILKDQGKTEAALAVLEEYDPLSASMGFRALDSFGDLYAELGRKDRAVAKYRESIAANNRYEDFNQAVRKKIEALEEK